MEKQLTPKLRFPEFKENWEELKYKDIYIFKTTNSLSRDNLNYEKGNVKNIHYGDIHTKFNSLFDINNENVPFINDGINISKIPDDCYLQEGDLVVADASEDYDDIGKMIEIINLNNEKVLAGLHTFLARKNSDKIVNGFSSFLMKSWKVRYQIMRIAQGTKVLSLSNKRLSEIELQIPQPDEQQKITSFLTAVDIHITLLTQQKEKLEQYKKGIMQQLFSQEIRFKDDNGNDFPDWEEKKLGDTCKIVVGGTPRTNVKEYWNGDIGWIGSGEIKNNIIKFPTKYITELGLKKSSTVLMPRETVVLAMTGTTLGKIGILDFDTCGNQSVAGFLPSEQFNSIFLFNKMQSIKNQILSFAGGAAQQGINKKNIESLIINLPSVKEQQKIASFLTAIDEQIEYVGKQIDTTTIFKKGLLQQMYV